MSDFVCTRRICFDAGHRVPGHEGKCKTPHGHRYMVDIVCRSRVLDDAGFVVDFGVVKDRVGGWIDTNLDHTFLAQRNDPVIQALDDAMIQTRGTQFRPVFWMKDPPTAESIAALIFRRAAELLSDVPIMMDHVRVYETPNCWADYPR
jgi:6-pyruvoyltetrahydropterin/6-carboxytetrahydropterin synthase